MVLYLCGAHRVAKHNRPHGDRYVNTFVQTKFSSTGRDSGGREWVFTPLKGIKKEYSFIKSIKGTFYMLYNLHDPFHRSPYPDKLVIKMGFEFPLKKKGSSAAQ